MEELKYFKGVKKENTISKRYRELAMKYHPDKARTEEERERFTAVMQEINAEHKEVLILLKYKALEKQNTIDKEKNKKETQTEPEIDKKSVLKNVASMFNLTQEQKQYFIKQGREVLNMLYDNIIENNMK